MEARKKIDELSRRMAKGGKHKCDHYMLKRIKYVGIEFEPSKIESCEKEVNHTHGFHDFVCGLNDFERFRKIFIPAVAGIQTEIGVPKKWGRPRRPRHTWRGTK